MSEKKINPKLWKPIVTERPKRIKVYKKSEPHTYQQYQPLSERYEVPGLMPQAPRRNKDGIPK